MSRLTTTAGVSTVGDNSSIRQQTVVAEISHAHITVQPTFSAVDAAAAKRYDKLIVRPSNRKKKIHWATELQCTSLALQYSQSSITRYVDNTHTSIGRLTTMLPEIRREFMLVRSMFTVTFQTMMNGRVASGSTSAGGERGRGGGLSLCVPLPFTHRCYMCFGTKPGVSCDASSTHSVPTSEKCRGFHLRFARCKGR